MPIGATHQKLALLYPEFLMAWSKAIVITVPADDTGGELNRAHERRIDLAIDKLNLEPNGVTNEICSAEFEDPESLVERLVCIVNDNIECANIAAAKQLAVAVCERR